MTLLPRRIESSTQMPNAASATVNRNNVTTSLFMSDANAGIAQNNSQDHSVLLEAGTYTLTTIYTKGALSGIIDAQLDGVSLGTVDSYAAAGSYNNVWSITSISIASSGVKTLRFTSSTKNASSAGYAVGISYYSFHRTNGSTGTGTLDYTSRHIDVNPWISVDSGTLARVQESVKLGGGYNAFYSTPVSATWNIALTAGTWSLIGIYEKDTNRGIATLTLGGTSIGTIDCYAASTSSNNVSTISGINIAQDGVYALVMSNPTKNASAVDYRLFWQWWTFQKTA